MQLAGAIPYFDSPAMRVLAYPAGQFAVLQYKSRSRTPVELAQALAATLSLLETCAWHKLLGDRRGLCQPLSAEETAQTSSFWRDYAAGHPRCLHVAALVSPVAYSALAAAPALPATRQNQLTRPSWFRVFDQPEAAVTWLKQCG